MADKKSTEILKKMRGMHPKDKELIVRRMKAMIAKRKYQARKEAEADE